MLRESYFRSVGVKLTGVVFFKQKKWFPLYRTGVLGGVHNCAASVLQLRQVINVFIVVKIRTMLQGAAASCSAWSSKMGVVVSSQLQFSIDL